MTLETRDFFGVERRSLSAAKAFSLGNNPHTPHLLRCLDLTLLMFKLDLPGWSVRLAGSGWVLEGLFREEFKAGEALHVSGLEAVWASEFIVLFLQ